MIAIPAFPVATGMLAEVELQVLVVLHVPLAVPVDLMPGAVVRLVITEVEVKAEVEVEVSVLLHPCLDISQG